MIGNKLKEREPGSWGLECQVRETGLAPDGTQLKGFVVSGALFKNEMWCHKVVLFTCTSKADGGFISKALSSERKA